MTQWTKIEPTHTRGPGAKRTKPCARRTANACHFIVPVEMTGGPRATFYSDGNGRIAVITKETGDYAVFADGSSKHLVRVIVPRRLWESFPMGTTDLPYEIEDGALVLTLPKSGKPAAPAWAAE